MDENKKSDSIEINIKALRNLKKNPWAIASVVLGVLLLVSLFLGFNSKSRNEVSENEIVEKTLNFLSLQVDGGEVTLDSISKNESYYDLVVNYKGEQVPLQVTLDGKYLIGNLIPINR